jgi:DNA sulfur modification protein DndD
VWTVPRYRDDQTAEAIQCSLERQKAEQGRRQQVFQGGDYPLVMDAPFATMDTHLKRSVPSGLRSIVPQMVILTNYGQWAGEVEEVLRRHVGAAFVLKLHNPGDPASGNKVPWIDTQIDYVVPEPDATTDWTVIREVSR